MIAPFFFFKSEEMSLMFVKLHLWQVRILNDILSINVSSVLDLLIERSYQWLNNFDVGQKGRHKLDIDVHLFR